MIHQSAIVSSKAQIGNNVEIGPFAVIYDDVVIDDNTIIHPNTVIYNGARIGKNCKIFPGATIAADPQDLKFNNESTLAILGDNTTVREAATINKGTVATGKTTVGKNCLIMAYAHVAHDCVVGDNVIMSNATQLAGHVIVEDWVIFGGMAKVTQFCRVGKHAMIGADAKVVKDILHYSLIGRVPAQVEGINKIGLKRRGFEDEVIMKIKDFFDTLFFSGLNTTNGIELYISKNPITIPEVAECIEFINVSSKGITR